MNVIGIDPSLSCTSVAFFEKGVYQETASIKVKARGKCLVDRFSRYQEICYRMDEMFKAVNGEWVCLIEGYSYGSKYNNEFLAEFGGFIRQTALSNFGDLVWEVAPTTLKKFITGSGNAKKAKVVSRVTRLLDVELQTDDEADAIALGYMGSMAACSDDELTSYQRDCIRKVFSPEDLVLFYNMKGERCV